MTKAFSVVATLPVKHHRPDPTVPADHCVDCARPTGILSNGLARPYTTDPSGRRHCAVKRGCKLTRI